MKNYYNLLGLLLGILSFGQKIQCIDSLQNPISLAILYNEKGKALGFTDEKGYLQDSLLFNLKDSDLLYINAEEYIEKSLTKKELYENSPIILERDPYFLNEVVAQPDRPQPNDKYAVIRAYVRSFVVSDDEPKIFMDGIVEYFLPLDLKGKVKSHVLEYRILKKDSLDELEKTIIELPTFKSTMLYTKLEKRMQPETQEKFTIYANDGKKPIGYFWKDKTSALNVDYIKTFENEEFNFSLFGIDIKFLQAVHYQEYNTSTLPIESAINLKYNKEIEHFIVSRKKKNITYDFVIFKDIQVLSLHYANKEQSKDTKNNEKKLDWSASNYSYPFWEFYFGVRPLPESILNNIHLMN